MHNQFLLYKPYEPWRRRVLHRSDMAESGVPLTAKSVDLDVSSPDWFTNVNNRPDIGHNFFDYTLNTTACADGTFCPWPNNQTCCFDNQGHGLTSYHYDAPMPTTAAGLSSFYAENGYQIAPITSSLSNNFLTTSLSSPLPAFPSTSAPTSPSSSLLVSPSTSASTPTSTYVSTPPPSRNPPSPLGTGIKVGIGVGVVGFLAIAGIFLLLLRRARRRRRDTRHFGALGAVGVAPSDSRQWEKPELVGEDARKEMEAREWRAELPGEAARTEMGAGDLRRNIFPELHG